MLGITDPTSVFSGKKADLGFDMSSIKEQNPDEINFGDDDDSDDVIDDIVEGSEGELSFQGPMGEGETGSSNPDKISLDSDEDKTGNGDTNGGKCVLQEESLSPKKTPLKLPPPSSAGELNLPKPVNSAPEVSDSKTIEIQQEKTKTDSSGSIDETVKSDIEKPTEDKESPVPPVKKFKRRNQSMYENTDNE